ncbi:MAG: hypothetical protein ABFD50_15820 [Smithella sp.]
MNLLHFEGLLFSDKVAVLSLVVAIISLLFSMATFAFMAILTLLGLRFSAKPKIHIDMHLGIHPTRHYLTKDELVEIRFELNNIGHIYAKPAASDIVMYINFDPKFSVIEARYGSALECITQEVRSGTNGSKYLKVKGIDLFYGEGGEDVVVKVEAPQEDGIYNVWIAARCSVSDLGLHEFYVQVGPIKS